MHVIPPYFIERYAGIVAAHWIVTLIFLRDYLFLLFTDVTLILLFDLGHFSMLNIVLGSNFNFEKCPRSYLNDPLNKI